MGYATRLQDIYTFVWAAAPNNYTGAAMTAQWCGLQQCNHVTVIITTGAWAGGTAAVTLSQGTALAGTGSKALAFPYYFTNTSATGITTKVTATSNTFNLDTANKQYIIEFDVATLDITNSFDYFTLAIASPGSNADYYSAIYILSGDRYQQQSPKEVLV